MGEKIKAFLLVIKNDLVDTWQRTKVLILGILVIFVYLKFNQIKDAILAYGAKKEMDSAQKQDGQEAAQEDADKKQADALVTQANALSSQQPAITEDWNKKK